MKGCRLLPCCRSELFDFYFAEFDVAPAAFQRDAARFLQRAGLVVARSLRFVDANVKYALAVDCHCEMRSAKLDLDGVPILAGPQRRGDLRPELGISAAAAYGDERLVRDRILIVAGELNRHVAILHIEHRGRAERDSAVRAGFDPTFEPQSKV